MDDRSLREIWYPRNRGRRMKIESSITGQKFEGTLRRIHIPTSVPYTTSTPYKGEYTYVSVLGSSSESPPLSDIELEDLRASKTEFERNEAPIYDDPHEFISALMQEREQAHNL